MTLDEKALQADFIIFSDGACSGNPGPGGWAVVIAARAGEVQELGGHEAATTNNRMEMMATIQGLRKIQALPGKVLFFTDSTYVIRGITQWIWGWKKRGWRNAEGAEVANKDLWQLLEIEVAKRKSSNLEWHYSRGHNGTPGNERCDEIAVAFSHGRWIDLYKGPLLEYQVAIYDLPQDTSLPEMRPAEEKKSAYSYLSYLGGVVCRHRDWPSCERRVKGQSGAKLKKAMSAGEESKILQDWGLPAKTEIQDS